MSDEYGPFTEDESRALSTLGAHITQRIAGSLARELKATSGTYQAGRLNDCITEAVQPATESVHSKPPLKAEKHWSRIPCPSVAMGKVERPLERFPRNRPAQSLFRGSLLRLPRCSHLDRWTCAFR